MKEIGVRKVLGGLKKQLIAQFITESVIIVLFATLFALIIFISTKNLLGSILNTAIPSLQSFPFYFVVFLLLFIFIVGFIAGIYPAFVLSSLKSVDSLKGKMAAPNESILLKKSLIAFQFATATIAFTGAILISKQVNLFLSKDVGYNKDYVISAQVPRDWSQAGVDKMITLRNQFKRLSSVKDASLSYEIPDGNNSGQSYIYKQGSDTAQAIPMQLLMSDENYLNLYQIPLVAGNRFMGGMADSANVLMNETAIKALGFKNAGSAAGRQVRFLGDPTIYTISGITKDFHFGSMQHKVAPIIMFNVQLAGIYRFMSFRINPGNITAGINDIQKKWAELMPGAPFEYKFMDDTLANLYKSEIQLKKAAYAATILALIIVLLGIIGLVSLSIQKRTKEIGIRKVLGSSVAGIMLLFIKDFLLVILIGGLVACPLAYIIMQHWLQGYAYRVDITAQPFVISISSLGLITALLICIQTTKAAITNPVKSLRTE
jgi:ABC-type antimicrobial peptide transport system permease subunit